jgi:hypothetical protein
MRKRSGIIIPWGIIVILAASCHTAHKSMNELHQEASKSSLSFKDSTGHTIIDSSYVKEKIYSGTMTVDSSYDKVTQEVVKETIDSNSIHREIIRTIKEKGNKRVEQSSTTIKNDSTGKKVSQGATVKQSQKQDSSVTISVINKDVKRASFLPWWIWLIAAVLIALGWWQRNPIIRFFTK